MENEKEFIPMSRLPEYWRLKIKGEIHWANRKRKCPQCGSAIAILREPREHYHCTGCGANFIE